MFTTTKAERSSSRRNIWVGNQMASPAHGRPPVCLLLKLKYNRANTTVHTSPGGTTATSKKRARFIMESVLACIGGTETPVSFCRSLTVAPPSNQSFNSDVPAFGGHAG